MTELSIWLKLPTSGKSIKYLVDIETDNLHGLFDKFRIDTGIGIEHSMLINDSGIRVRPEMSVVEAISRPDNDLCDENSLQANRQAGEAVNLLLSRRSISLI